MHEQFIEQVLNVNQGNEFKSNSQILGIWSGGFVLSSKSFGGRDELIFQISQSQVAAQKDLAVRIAGLSLWITELNLSEGKAQCLVISPAKDSYNVMFGLLSEYLAEEFIANLKYVGSVFEIQDALLRWSEFLKRRRGNARSEKIQGLVGELLTIRDLLSETDFAWTNWVGPSGSPQDFKGSLNWLEVKTTSNRKGALVHKISGVDQLEIPASGSLHVISFRLSLSKNGQHSVTDLLGEVSEMPTFKDAAAQDYLFQSAEELGVDETIPLELARFDLYDCRAYSITEGFPRLLRRDLPSDSRITEISYSVDFSAASEYLIDIMPKTLKLNS